MIDNFLEQNANDKAIESLLPLSSGEDEIGYLGCDKADSAKHLESASFYIYPFIN